MLAGVVPFPPEFAARYRAKGYWQDRSLRDEFAGVFARFAERVALIRRRPPYHLRRHRPAQRPTSRSTCWTLGLKPLDRVVVQLPNVAEFVILYFALQKIGAIPIAALVTHRFAEISQFAALSGRDDGRHARPRARLRLRGRWSPRMRAANAGAQTRDRAGRGAGRIRRRSTELIEKPATLPLSELAEIAIDPDRSGRLSALGRHDRHSQAHPAHAQRLRLQFEEPRRRCATSTGAGVLLVVLPIAHNLPLACPGIQGFMFNGGAVVLSAAPRGPTTCSPLIAAPPGHAHQGRAGAADPLAQRSGRSASYDISSLRDDPERRPAPAARGAAALAQS